MRNTDDNKFEQPDFLLAEIPVKNGSFNDDRLWVYCNKTFSLIEFIFKEDYIDNEFVGTQESFVYTDVDGNSEDWIGIYIQNNCALVGKDQRENLSEAWSFLESYFIWEEQEGDFNY